MLEKINRSFGAWYEGLFGGGDDVRPKDILRRIFQAMEDNRKEGFDNRVYVPNQYVLEISVDDEEEKEYLLSFLDRDELEAAIRRYCQQNHYHIRGALDFTVKEAEDAPGAARRGEKVRVRCRYNTKITGPESAPELPPAANAAPSVSMPMEERTVAAVRLAGDSSEEMGTVPAVTYGALVVYAPDRAPYRYTIARQSVTMGRSARAENDIILDSDGQVSKSHARIELDADGRFTLYDLGSTNGTKVNGRRVDNRTLNDGDEITLGATRILFSQSAPSEQAVRDTASPIDNRSMTTPLPSPGRSQGAFGGAVAELSGRPDNPPSASSVPVRPLRSRTARLVLLDGDQEVDDFLLASETLLGRGVTNDIVLPDRSVAMRHVRICHDGAGYTVEALAEGASTTLNGLTLALRRPEHLHDGDRLCVGDLTLQFAGDAE